MGVIGQLLFKRGEIGIHTGATRRESNEVTTDVALGVVIGLVVGDGVSHVHDLLHRGVAVGRLSEFRNVLRDRFAQIDQAFLCEHEDHSPGERLGHREHNVFASGLLPVQILLMHYLALV